MGRLEPETKHLIIFSVGISGFWLLLWLKGFPKPMNDDLFLIGAAIQLVKTGEFFNPLLAHWSEVTIDHFFVQTPFYSYVLAGWLKIWGIHTNSLLSFQCICYSLFSIATAIVFRKYHFSWLSIICIPLVYGLWMSEMGLRHDAFGIALLMLGLWSLTQDRVSHYLAGFSLLGFAVGTSPVLISYATPFTALLIIQNAQQKSPSYSWTSYSLHRLLSLITAFLIVFSTLLICIRGELKQFLADMSWHAALRVSQGWEIPQEVLFIIRNGHNGFLYGSLYICLLTTVSFLVINHRQQSTALKWFTSTLLAALGLNLWTYSGTLATNLHFGISLGIVMIALNLKLKVVSRITLLTFCTMAMMIYKSQALIAFLAQHKTPSQSHQSALIWSQENPEHDYFIDAIAARFVFDYNLPKSTFTWEYLDEEFSTPLSLHQKEVNSVWLISSAKAAVTEGLPEYERVKIFGRRFGSVPRAPHDVMAIDAEQSIHFFR